MAVIKGTFTGTVSPMATDHSLFYSPESGCWLFVENLTNGTWGSTPAAQPMGHTLTSFRETSEFPPAQTLSLR